MSRRRRTSAALALAVAAALGAGCGGDYSDLLLVRRTGSLPDARLELLINDGGTARCDRGPERALPPRLLLRARAIVRDLEPELERERVHPPRGGALLRFHVETAQGELTFSDVDGARDPDLGRLIAFVRTAAREVCGRAR